MIKERLKIVCGFCTQCCQWGEDPTLRPKLTHTEQKRFGIIMPSDGHGNCHFLSEKDGCTIYDSRPVSCQAFDCRDLLDKVRENNDSPFIMILVAAALRS